MKAIYALACLVVPAFLSAAEVRIGDGLNDVRAALGAPRGQLKLGERQVLHYERGEVELRGGVVTRVAFLSDAEYAALQAQAARTAEQNARIDSEGEALKERKLADRSFAAAPAAYRLEFWQNFATRYPRVSVGEQLFTIRMRLAQEYAARAAEEERLAALEARVAAVEDSAETNSPYRYGGYSYGYGGYFPSYRPHYASWDDHAHHSHEGNATSHVAQTPHAPADTNPYRWNPPFSSYGMQTQPSSYPFGPIGQAATDSRTRRGGRF